MAWQPWNQNGAESAVGLAANADVITEVPGDDRGRGLVHSGLRPGKKGEHCAGEYQIVGTANCSHGPDEPPAGLDVKKRVAPIARTAAAPELTAGSRSVPADADAAEAAGGRLADGGALTVVPDAGTYSTPALAAGVAAAAAPEVGANGIVCDGDGQTGKRVQVLYVYEVGTTSRFAQYEASFRTWAAGVDTIYDASAKETGGSRHLRYVTTADCQVDAREVEVPAGGLKDFSATMSALKKLSWNRADRKYMIFAESQVYCGIGTFTGDDRKDATNRNNSGASYGRNDSGCWTAAVAAHELGHNLGAVSNSAPNSSKAGHCVDDYDVMCYKDTATTVLKTVCPNRAQENRLDCNHDDYYSTDVKPSSYLADHWNVADNQFLIAGTPGGSGSPSPTPSSPRPSSAAPSPSVTKPTTSTPSPSSPSPSSPSPSSPSPSSPAPTSSSPTVPPSPTTTPTSGPGKGLTTLTVSDAQPTSVRLSWPARSGTTRYGVVVNGRTLGQVAGTGVQIVGLRPGTAYRLQVTAGGQPYTEEVSLTTDAAVTPRGDGWFALTNALTGTTADLYGARAADRTPLVLHQATGAASEQWRFETVDGGVRLVSRATGKCVTPLAGKVVAGVPLAQRACSTDRAQVFKISTTPAGLTLTSAAADGSLVVGLGSQRYGGQSVLVLQQREQVRHQTWVAAPA
ncbi:RICIN domain-containing protein [Actinoplanes sp. NPDC048967]|uniref:RICIN domain-containing protein n=1 Tax=Actinoplanes sp. NPDC048967 TaxID=3155269 RepID=UPI0033F0D0C1